MGNNSLEFPSILLIYSALGSKLLKVQDHRICRKVSSIPNHPLRANFPETKITRYNLRNKSPAMPAIHTDRFKNTFFNRIVFKNNVAL